RGSRPPSHRGPKRSTSPHRPGPHSRSPPSTSSARCTAPRRFRRKADPATILAAPAARRRRPAGTTGAQGRRPCLSPPQDHPDELRFDNRAGSWHMGPIGAYSGPGAPCTERHSAMSDLLSRLLESRDWLMADGATGTNLFNMGLSSGEAPELWNVDRPENIRALYQSAVDAGSDIFLTNTFGANASRLKLHGAEGRVRELNRVGAAIGREVADATGRPVVVAASMGPTGEIMAPMRALTHARAVEMFHEQAEGLKEGGADVLWVETISAPEEFRAAAEGCALAGMPWCGTMSFDTAGRTMMGVTSAQMVALVDKLAHRPLAFG